MKISIGMLETNTEYAERLLNAMNARYQSDFEFHTYETKEELFSNLGKHRIRIILSCEEFKFSLEELMNARIARNVLDSEGFSPDDRISLAYLVDSQDIELYNESPTIPRYIRIDEFQRSLIKIFQVLSTNLRLRSNDNTNIRTILFTSPAGGVGTTTLAIATARQLARTGSKVLYFNLDYFSNEDGYFQSPIEQTFSDLIYTIKFKRQNFLMALESLIARDDNTGVYFFKPSPKTSDRLELKESEEHDLLQALYESQWDFIVFDSPFIINDNLKFILHSNFANVIVSDGRRAANDKVRKAVQVLDYVDQREDSTILINTFLFYNRFSSKNTSRITDIEMETLGGINRFEGFEDQNIIDEIINKNRVKAIVDKITNNIDNNSNEDANAFDPSSIPQDLMNQSAF
jgi:cellulose biosynthesis protein BcsQ